MRRKVSSKAKYPKEAKTYLTPDVSRDLAILKRKTGKSISSLIRLGVDMLIENYKRTGDLDA